jgi:hypothetical protein
LHFLCIDQPIFPNNPSSHIEIIIFDPDQQNLITAATSNISFFHLIPNMMQLLTGTFSIFLFFTTSLSLAAPHPEANSTHPHPHSDTNATNHHHDIHHHQHHDIHHHHNSTSQLDKRCQEISLLENLVHELNATAANTTEIDATKPADKSKQPHHSYLNLTSLPALLANATAQLQNLTANTTLAGLCKTARQVEHDCSPLLGLIWANMTDEAGGEGRGNTTKMDGGRGHGVGNGNGTGMGMMPNATAVAEAEKNATLVAICEAWVMGMVKGNLSKTDAGK